LDAVVCIRSGDISLICFNLELCPGRTVLESGTGSGSLTTSLSRAVGPNGAVNTFEFHEERAQVAAEEFKRNGALRQAIHCIGTQHIQSFSC
jgi:tRNA (adenine57-N1/adenine58-N1)-methyltransferase